MTILYFIFILGTPVFVHELGHFIFAKLYKVHVYEFSLGMGPRLFKFNRKNDETDYCIRLFPIGGFVQMAGEEIEVDEEIPEEKRLTSKPAFQRFMIMIAGVMMNFITAIIILFFIGLFNTVSLNNVYVDGSTIKGLKNGDKIVEINNSFVNNYDKLALEMTVAGNKEFTMTVKNKEGKKYKVNVNPIEVGSDFLPYGKDYGFSVKNLEINKSSIDGLNKGYTIVKVNGEKIDDFDTLLSTLDEVGNKKFTLTIKNKKDKEKEFVIKPKEKKEDTSLGFSYGFYLKGEEQKGFITAVKYSFLKFFSTIEQMIFTVFYLIIGKISLTMMSGPVGIYSIVGTVSTAGFTSVLSLLSLICINVGFINLLPFPAFDGCHVLFIIIE